MSHDPLAPLQGIRILDLTRVLAGPWATQLLSDLGADVVKIERRGGGDDTRRWAPPYFTAADGEREASFFLCCNRGKRSVEIDFGSADDLATLHALAAAADVVVENFKVGGLVRYGLDAASLRAERPELIYCSITGFGQTGPYAQWPGYDFVMQGMGGLMSVTGLPDDAPGGGPMKVGVALTDLMTGLYAANAIQAALIERQRTGEGRTIDLALLDVQVAGLANQAMSFFATGANPPRLGNAAPGLVPYDLFDTADGRIIIACGNDTQFRDLCVALGRSEFSDDPRFRLNDGRVAHRRALMALIEPIVATRRSADWTVILRAAGVPVGPINTVAEVFEDEQVVARGLRVSMPHGMLDEVPGVACPIRFDGRQLPITRGPPTLGEHNREVAAAWRGATPA